jgi:protein-S-isoprenylcysteine O-methyltransferase Ste14
MYGSAIFGAWGILMKNITWYGLGIAILTTTLAVITALKEETENIRYFGEEYVQYKKNTRMFMPFVI